MATGCKLVVPVALLMVSAASAQVRNERNISLELANQLAAAAVATCLDKGYDVTATVVDRAGVIKSVQRADNAGPHTLDSSKRKAFTAVSAKTSTSSMMEMSQQNLAAANLGQITDFLLVGGGLPVKLGNEVIGAIGIGGAPGGHLDEQCAHAALEKVKDRLK